MRLFAQNNNYVFFKKIYDAVTYVNALASFVDPHTLAYSLKVKGKVENKTLTARHIVIAVGGRPHIPADVPGAVEHAITSDDIFSLDRNPGKVLCVGGGYISLECAGFLTELGLDVSVAARSILLRDFDRQCVDKVGSLLGDLGVKILMGVKPTNIMKLPTGRLQVVLEDANGAEKFDTFDTVLYATGRLPDLKGLNLAAAGVELSPSGKIAVTNETTNVPFIHAVGDVCDSEGKLELTPVAVHAGELLARRLFAGSTAVMNYNLVATTIFTPYEFGTVGLSEEDAVKQFGEEDVEIYLSEFTTLEISAVHRIKHRMHGEDEDMGHCCLSKLVCVKSQGERVVGFHFVGPNAGEITQVGAVCVFVWAGEGGVIIFTENLVMMKVFMSFCL